MIWWWSGDVAVVRHLLCICEKRCTVLHQKPGLARPSGVLHPISGSSVGWVMVQGSKPFWKLMILMVYWWKFIRVHHISCDLTFKSFSWLCWLCFVRCEAGLFIVSCPSSAPLTPEDLDLRSCPTETRRILMERLTSCSASCSPAVPASNCQLQLR